MNSTSIREILIHAVTAFDRKESTKRGHNRNALGIYVQRIADICADIANGANPRDAIVAGFSGRLAAACLKACNLPAYTKADAFGGPICYTPAISRNLKTDPMNTKCTRSFLLHCPTANDAAGGIVCWVRDTRYSSTWAITRTGSDVDVLDPDRNAELSEREIRALLQAWDTSSARPVRCSL